MMSTPEVSEENVESGVGHENIGSPPSLKNEVLFDQTESNHSQGENGTCNADAMGSDSEDGHSNVNSFTEETNEENGDKDEHVPYSSADSHENETEHSSAELSDTAPETLDNSSSKKTALGIRRCLVCGPPKDTAQTEYKRLSFSPDIEREIRELLKVLSPPSESDACCERCLGYMKIFMTLKNDFLNMKRKIIALHIDAQLDLPDSGNCGESFCDDNELSDVDGKNCSSLKSEKDGELFIKHEVDDEGLGDENYPTADEKGIVKKYKCQHCNRGYSGMYDLKIHLLKEHESIHTGEKPFKCQYCEKSFRRKNNCVQHEKKHKENASLKCKTCSKKFPTREECDEHEKTHCAIGVTTRSRLVKKTPKKKEESYKCSYCDKKFTRKDAIVLHERTHTGERPFKCKHCSKTFCGKSSCVKHEREKHGKNAVSRIKRTAETEKDRPNDGVSVEKEKKQGDASKPDRGVNQCSYCDKTFTRRNTLVLHEMIHSDDRLICKRCDKAFTRRGDLLEHEKIHEYKCSYCGKSCWGSKALTKHERYHGEKTHKCSSCDMAFASKAQLEVHVRTHTGEKPYLCQYCTRSFAQISTLKLHERTRHTGEKPFKCQYCDERFPVKLSCEEHERFHTGEKPFKCDYCDKRFVRKSNWRDHVKSHLGIKPHICTYCGKGFRDKNSLLIHERTHTGERPFVCKYCDKSFIRKSKCNEHEKIHTGEKQQKAAKNQASKVKNVAKVQKNQQPTEDLYNNGSSDHHQNNNWMVSQHSSGSFVNQQYNDSTFRTPHTEEAFRATQSHTDSPYRPPPLSDGAYRPAHSTSTPPFRPPHTEGLFRPQHCEASYRGPQSSNVFPTPEAVYVGDNPPNPYMYSMYMPGM